MRPIITARVAVTTLAACLPLWAASVPATHAEEYADRYVDRYADKYVDNCEYVGEYVGEYVTDAPALADTGISMNSAVVAKSHAAPSDRHFAALHVDEHVDVQGGDAPAFSDTGMLKQADSAVLAKSPAQTLERQDAQKLDVAVKPAGAPSLDGFGVALEADQLELYRGGTDTVFNDMKLSGIVSNNSATSVVTGSNTIGESSFSNASGLSTVIQNSGANVLIQNATIINLQMK